MIAAALLIVLGAATLMQLAGLSMAMGAFLAGVHAGRILLSARTGSRYRAVPRDAARPVLHGGRACRWNSTSSSRTDQLILLAVPLLMLVKAADHLRALPADRLAAQRRGAHRLLLPQGGEFGFVLFTAGRRRRRVFRRAGRRCWWSSSPCRWR